MVNISEKGQKGMQASWTNYTTEVHKFLVESCFKRRSLQRCRARSLVCGGQPEIGVSLDGTKWMLTEGSDMTWLERKWCIMTIWWSMNVIMCFPSQMTVTNTKMFSWFGKRWLLAKNYFFIVENGHSSEGQLRKRFTYLKKKNNNFCFGYVRNKDHILLWIVLVLTRYTSGQKIHVLCTVWNIANSNCTEPLDTKSAIQWLVHVNAHVQMCYCAHFIAVLASL